jgi:transcriptional regulator with XRE-family HTH domain
MDIATLLTQIRVNAGLSQRDLARRAGTSQPAVARLEQPGANPTFDTVQRLARAAGFELRLELSPAPATDPLIDAYKRDIDRTLLRENLKKSVHERLRSLTERQEFMREMRRATRKAKDKP